MSVREGRTGAFTLNRTGAEFLITDLDLASTFMDISETSHADETIRRNHQNARKAYDTVLNLFSNLTLNNEERQTIQMKLTFLKKRLQAVEEQF